jgi:hypothetical protein
MDKIEEILKKITAEFPEIEDAPLWKIKILKAILLQIRIETIKACLESLPEETESLYTTCQNCQDSINVSFIQNIILSEVKDKLSGLLN